MHDLFLLIAGIGLGSFILVIVRMMCEFNHIVTTRVFSLLLLGAACYMLQPFVMNAPNVLMALKIVSTVTPALFWMCASTLFNTEQTKHRLHWGHYLGGRVCFCLGLYTCVFSSPSVEHSFTHTLTLLLTVLLVLMGMFLKYKYILNVYMVLKMKSIFCIKREKS